MGDPRTSEIDRIACPWLIARFIDKEPEFLYVPSPQVFEVAKRTRCNTYDIRRRRAVACGRAVQLRRILGALRAASPALHTLAPIVRGRGHFAAELTPQSAGLYAIRSALSYTCRRPRDAAVWADPV